MPNSRSLVAVTGASGFVGRALVHALQLESVFDVRAVYRSEPQSALDHPHATVGDLEVSKSLVEAFAGVDVIVHAAARAHVLNDRSTDVLDAYRRVNVIGTRNVLRAAIEAKVRRIVFLSSIKVNGECTPIDRPFIESDRPLPRDPYGLTKLEAEETLRAAALSKAIEVTILRLPLVYGPGVKGNLRRLAELIGREIPIPLGAVKNLRSMIGIDNLVSAVATAAVSPAAAGRTFLLSDQADISTPELVTLMAEGLGSPARLWRVPLPWLGVLGRATGRREEIERLTGSLRIDSSAFSEAVGWTPRITPREGLLAMTRRH